jgi:prepilin-type N-terminal cleavage/methylation domain-containing protein
VRRLRAQAGFSLIEVLVAMTVLAVATVGTLHAFTGSVEGTAKAEQRASMVVIAQRELERLRGVPYAQLGLDSIPGASTEAPRTGESATEELVTGGAVDPGPTPFEWQGVKGRIYRFVTWRRQECPLLTVKVGTEIDNQVGSGSAEAGAALGDLCPGDEHTKRIVVAVVADDPFDPGRVFAPVRAQTIFANPSEGAISNLAGLAVEQTAPAADVATAQEQLYANSVTQALHLYDTPCNKPARQAVGSSHATHDTGQSDETCASPNFPPDLMGLAPPAVGEPAADYSSDLLRSPADGLALKRDDRAGSCVSEPSYAPADAATRRWSLHRWSTRPLAAAAETLATGGRGVLSLYTHTVGGVAGSGRLCVLVRRESDGLVLGSADFRLAQWPTATTQLAISFDLAHATIAAGDRLSLTVRNHPDSAHDLELVYDRADAPASLSLTMTQGKELP